MEFDYVVVGAGSSGCVVANRLSAGGKYSVALLEAGGRDWNPWIHIPVGYFKTMSNPNTDWCLETQADPGLNGRKLKWPRGKVLGGSSSINGLLYVRGQSQDYDTWRQLGNTGWGWDDVLPMFKRAESWTVPGASEDRGRDGPLTVSENSIHREVVDRWVDAAENAGYLRNEDYNSGDQEGVGYFQLTTRNGRRCSTAVAYLNPARGRKNLEIITHAHVKRVAVENGRATKVVAIVKGQEKEIRARKEIVLSAGAIGSPHILMQSGIGPGAMLASAAIEVVKDAPDVGRNMQDHLQARPVYKTTLPTINIETNNIFKQCMIALEYALRRTGPMTMAASLGVAFLKTNDWVETPDIQFHIQPFSADTPQEGAHKFSAFTASVCQLRPESRGHLELDPKNPGAMPLIHPNYLATQTDQETMVRGVQIARKVADHAPLKEVLVGEHGPGDQIAYGDDAGILEWIRNTATTIYHPTGTCRMGVDDKAVVDPELKVNGVEGLRVAEASMMPTIPSGNTNAPCIMVGEKLSDMMLRSANA